MKPISLEVSNFLRLKSVFVQFPDSGTLVIGGKNAQGKSSTIEAIVAALGGKPDYKAPIHNGHESAQIVMKTDMFTVTRIFTPTATRLEIRGADGKKFDRPQELLDGLFSSLSFDPCAFLRMAPKAQVQTLANLLGLDFSLLEQTYKSVFDDRTIVNREWEKLKNHAEKLPFHPDAPAEEMRAADLAERLQSHSQITAANNAKRQELAGARAEYERAATALENDQKRLAELEEQVKRLKASCITQEDKLADILANGKALASEVEALIDPDPKEVEEVKAAMRNVEAANGKTRDNNRRAEAMREAEDKGAESSRLTAQLKEIEAEKRRLIAAAHFPVEGMGFADDGEGVTFNALPLNQASSAEQLRVSCAMGFALNPKCKLLLIRDGSLLDDDNLKLVTQLASDNGGQVVIERVGKGEEVNVVIEDGEVIERRGEITTAQLAEASTPSVTNTSTISPLPPILEAVATTKVTGIKKCAF